MTFISQTTVTTSKWIKKGNPSKKKTVEKQKENNHFDFSYGKVKRQTLTQSTGE